MAYQKPMTIYLIITNAPSMFWDHPNSTYARKSPKLDPPPSPLVRNRTHLA